MKIAALAVFAVSGFLQIYPLGLHPARGLNDTQDCLLNAWILDWGHQQLLKNPLQFFQANAFYPNANTLSYSEHLLPLTVLSLPVSLVTSNPILAYNFVFFLCCLLNAYAMFLLVRHLTDDALAGIAAGLIFAFSATLMQNIAHLQLMAAWFLPLALLYLHKYFEEGRLRHSILFAVCLTLQALACIYYGLFFLSVLVVVLPAALWLHAEKIKARFCLRLIWPLLTAGGIMLLFSLPYLWLFRHFRFERPLAAGAEIQNYLAVPPHNILLAGLLHRLGSYEFFLFPGMGAVALAAYYLFQKRAAFRCLSGRIRTFFGVLALLSTLLLLVILISGGTGFKLGPVSISARNPARPAFGLLMVLTAWFIASKVVFLLKKKRQASESDKRAYLYLLIFGWALFLSFGSGFAILRNSPFNQRFHGDLFSPFHWFYDYVPGFKGIRVPSRYAVFVLLAVAVLAGFGWKALSARLRTGKVRVLAFALLVVFLNAEFLSVPQKLKLLPVGGDIPPTYRWLKDQPGDFAIIELPQFDWIPDESAYMYFSLFHGKRLVNGYSGFIPYSADYLRAVFREFPSQGATDILQQWKVKYVVFHAKDPGGRPRPHFLDSASWRLIYNLRLVRSFRYGFNAPNSLDAYWGEDYIFEILPPWTRPIPSRQTVELPPGRWAARADLQPELVP
ncbi:MAG: hypothetical protein MUP19_03895, partial [Candidatus Aminicenantes bacterium]|nr:hypothetical protein [Candidatus Aminicenantes bacterium]